MVEGLDSTYDAAIFLGYHARAGTPAGSWPTPAPAR
jgi:D-aminopeptidase